MINFLELVIFGGEHMQQCLVIDVVGLEGKLGVILS